jgi:hypothetical protein
VPTFKDLTGLEFGAWTVIRRGLNQGARTTWTCVCRCGAIKTVAAGNLVSGKTTQCKQCSVENLAGRQFGKLTVVRRTTNCANNKTRWECSCECGKTLVVRQKHLVGGGVSSCGCLRTPELRGKSFGRWFVKTRSNTSGGSRWLCNCSCGTVREVSAESLLKGASRSCGCLARELVAKRATKHGLTGTPQYRAMHAHKRRTAQTKAGGFFTPGQISDLLVSQVCLLR